MMLPENYEGMSDAKLLKELKKTYDDEAAQYILSVLKGEETPPFPME